MVFSKSFPNVTPGSTYPVWEEIYLTDEEELEQEKLCREKNIEIMKECLNDAKNILKKKEFKSYETSVINLARSLFEKRASHEVFFKESKCKEKFDEKFKK